MSVDVDVRFGNGASRMRHDLVRYCKIYILFSLVNIRFRVEFFVLFQLYFLVDWVVLCEQDFTKGPFGSYATKYSDQEEGSQMNILNQVICHKL